MFRWLLISMVLPLFAAIETNEVRMQAPPKWLTESRVQKVTDQVQDYLEWRIRKIQVYWYTGAEAFKRVHRWPSDKVQAVYLYRDKSIHLGPKVNEKNFDQVFGHELVHAILHQKYGESVPIWLQEGLANYVAKKDGVDYKWLLSQPKTNPTHLTHPQAAGQNSSFHYQASLALVEMISSRCKLSDLLQLSVGKKMETYLKNYCEIKDINTDYQAWIKQQAENPKPKKPSWKTW